jgi:hypothetical protein
MQSPTEEGAGNATGNTKGTPASKSMKRASTKKKGTMGAAPKGSMKMQKEDRNASPASPAEGAKKEK